jgi:MFS family permease
MSPPQKFRTFESLGFRDYRLLWLSQISTSLGLWMDQTARSWLIYSLTRSPFQLGLVSALRGIPLLAFGVIAGVVADRYSRKAQLAISQIVNFFLNITLATLILTGRVQIWHIYVTGFLSGTVQAFQQPARQAMINDLAGEEHLLNAVALSSAAFHLSRSVGPALCGLIIQFFDVDIAYYTQAVLIGLATLWIVQIRVPESAAPAASSKDAVHQSFFSSAKEGFSYIISHKLILGLMVLGLVPVLLGMPFMSLMPLFAVDVLHGDATTQGLLLTMAGVGALIGALAIASMGYAQGNGKMLIGGVAGFGLGLVFFSQSPVLWMAIVFISIVGFCDSGYNSQNNTIIQMLAPTEMRGRVLGIYYLNRGLMPLGSLIAGALAAFIGGPYAVTIMGASCLILAVCVALFIPDIWKLSLSRGDR